MDNNLPNTPIANNNDDSSQPQTTPMAPLGKPSTGEAGFPFPTAEKPTNEVLYNVENTQEKITTPEISLNNLTGGTDDLYNQVPAQQIKQTPATQGKVVDQTEKITSLHSLTNSSDDLTKKADKDEEEFIEEVEKKHKNNG